MSINPVPGVEAASTQPTEASPHRNRSAAANPRPAPPEPEPGPKPEADLSPSAPALTELPEDEVQVQRDSGAGGEIVIKYLDQSGGVILQVPSSQVLEVARAIDQEVAQEEKTLANRDAAQSSHEGDKVHGD
jgi:hypothetical protein